jgi:hypothetical protein
MTAARHTWSAGRGCRRTVDRPAIIVPVSPFDQAEASYSEIMEDWLRDPVLRGLRAS